jgi:protease I
MNRKSLKRVRVAVLAVDGFEQVEVTLPMAALRRAGADVRVVSLRPGRLRGMNFIWPGRKIPVDDTVAAARVEDYGALLLPGGFVNPDLLRQSEAARELVRAFDTAGRPIATLCHGPEVLISAGLVRGRKLASWPGIADDIRNAGGTWLDEKVVQDGNWVSSRSPLDLTAFIPAMIDLFAERAPRVTTSLPRRMRWAAGLSSALKWAAVPLAVAAVRGQKAGALARKLDLQKVIGPVGIGVAGWLVLRALKRGRALRVPKLVSRGYQSGFASGQGPRPEPRQGEQNPSGIESQGSGPSRETWLPKPHAQPVG